MPATPNDEPRINLSIPIAVLERLFADQQLCAADLVSLDRESHASLRHLMLSVCAQQLKGYARQCDTCLSQSDCQHSALLTTPHCSLPVTYSSTQLH